MVSERRHSVSPWERPVFYFFFLLYLIYMTLHCIDSHYNHFYKFLHNLVKYVFKSTENDERSDTNL